MSWRARRASDHPAPLWHDRTGDLPGGLAVSPSSGRITLGRTGSAAGGGDVADHRRRRGDGAGHRIYTPAFLRVYDPVVLGFNSHVVWRIPVRQLTALYRLAITSRHLDVGPGTGYLLQHTAPEGASLTLLDANPHVLAYASRRLAAWSPVTVQADVLHRLPVQGLFGSAALSYVLHCLPGPVERKAVALRNVAAVLADDGVLFGATILGERRFHTALGWQMLRDVNRRGIFSNLGDTEAGIRTALDDSFAVVHTSITGSVMRFLAVRPRR